jgi:bifunctional non-homologous end joining protein LigD
LAATAQDATVRVDGVELVLTHLDRIYWPRDEQLQQPPITKREFIRYLVAMAPRMLPHLVDRPLTLFRWPEGIARRRILVKHWEGAIPRFVSRVRIFSEAKGKDDEYLLCNNLATLVWLARNGTLELHVWHSRVVASADASVRSTAFAGSKAGVESSIVEYPDYIVFDVDPYIYSGAEARGKEPAFSAPAFDKGRQVAFRLKDLLHGMRLKSFVKTSGKTGLHVLVPIRRTLPYSAVRELARTISEHLLRAHPADVTTEWATERRTGKVFLDYNMNVRGKSLIAPYCPRGLPGAPVSMPLTWEQLKRAYPTDYRLTTVERHSPRSAWTRLNEGKQDLETLLVGPRG